MDNVEQVKSGAKDLLAGGGAGSAHMDFSPRTTRVLLRLGIHSYEEIDGIGRIEIGRMRGCGQKTFDEITAKMRELGYEW